MIKIEDCEVKMAGTVSELLTDLSLIVESVNDVLKKKMNISEEVAKKALQHCFEMAYKSDDEIAEDTARMQQEIMERYFSAFMNAFGAE